MKYVIDCTPEQLKVIKEILGEDANRAGTSFWSSPVCIALGEARPLSELCEEEAKRVTEEVINDPEGSELFAKLATHALRSFGSKQ